MMQWLVELDGKGIDLEYVSSKFSSEECSITKEGSVYYLRSARFDSLTDAKDVHDSATKLLENINGLAAVSWLGFHAVGVERVVEVGENRGRRPFIFEKGVVTARLRVSAQVTVVRADGTVDLSEQPTEVETWLRIALEQPCVRHALAVFASLDNSLENPWYGLYKVYDTIERDVGGSEEIVERGWATRNYLGRFTQTAAHHRHAKGKVPVPKKPISPCEAKSFIRRILRAWLDQKCQ